MTDNNNNCVVCFKNVRIYSVGECDHPVCYECSTRMRVLCRQNECPMCRHEMSMVVFTERIRPFRRIKKDYSLYDEDYHIAFENSYIQEAFENLLQYVCKRCHNKPFNTFEGLTDHMRRVHDLFSCDLCVDNLKIFPKEWRYYTRSDLNKHRKVGDVDDRSHRGHPLCEFCNVRYMDRDELYRHLRKDHLFCHICDSAGIQQFYGMYTMLRDHYRQDHFLCEEGECIKEEFTSVFPTEIDLKAHKALVHYKNIKNKLAVKQARTLELEFTLAPRNANDRRGRPYGINSQENDEEEAISPIDHNNHYSEPETSRNVVATWDESAFPSLTNQPTTYTLPRSKPIRESNNRLTFNDENFPALGSETSIKFNITSNVDTRPSTSGGVSSTNISVQVNRNRNRNSNRAHTAAPSTSTLSLTWVKKAKEKKPVPENTQQPTESRLPNPPPLNKNNFPKLSAGFNGGGESQKKNKKSSVSIHIEENQDQKKTNYNVVTNKSIANNKNEKCDKKSTQTSVKQNEKHTQENENKSNCFLLNANRKKVKMKPDVDNYVPLNNLSDVKNMKQPVASSSRANENAASPRTSKKSHVSTINHVNNCDTKISVDKIKNNDKKKKEKCEIQPTATNKENKNDIKISKNSPKKGENEKKKTVVKETQENLLKESNKISQKSINQSKDVKSPAHKNNQRKKSELKIGPLNEATQGGANSNNSDVKSNVKSPPPGFEKSITPPPGLTRPSPKSYDQFHVDNSALNFSQPLFVYQQPEDFVTRNSNLIDKIGGSLMKNNDEALNDFKNTSLLFREGYISAASYYLYCMENIENDKFDDVFVDLVVLLPNILKQQELWTFHQSMKTDSNQISKVEHCPVCFQILKPADFNSHAMKHSLQSSAQFSKDNATK